jgi:hypothetical protein
MIKEGQLTRDKPLVLKKFGNPRDDSWYWYPDESCFARFESWLNKDMIVVILPLGTIPEAKCITSKFISVKDFEGKYANGFYGSLYLTTSQNNLKSYDSPVRPKTCPSYSDTDYKNGICWTYGAPAIAGDCGNILAVNDNKANGVVIAGLHMVGTQVPGYGFAFPIFREQLDQIMKLLGKTKSVLVEEFEPNFVQNSAFPDHMVVGKGECKPPQRKSDIQRSPLFGLMGKVTHFPARLKDYRNDQGEIVSPIAKARAKYVSSKVNFDIRTVKMISQVSSNYIYQHCIPETLRENYVLDFETACAGIPGDTYARGLRRPKSAGWNWNMRVPPGFKGKQHIFGLNDDFEFTSDTCKEVKLSVDNIINRAKQGIRTVAVCTTNPKDEVLPYDKVMQDKLRLFFGYPVDHLIPDRMYNLLYRRFKMLNRIISTSCIGINVYSWDWDKLARHLSFDDSRLINVPMHIAGDHSAFDGKIPYCFSLFYTEHKNQFYMDENSLLRHVLDQNVINSYQIFDNTITVWNGSHPSGGPDTADRNTFIHLEYICYAVLLIWFPPIGISPIPNCTIMEGKDLLVHFFSVSRHAIFGDDHDSTIHPSSIFYNVITQSAMTIAYEMMGLKYTDDNKTDEDFVYRTIHDISFLKRKFVYDNLRHRWIAPLELESIQKSLDWMSSSKTADNDFLNTINTAINEYALHDENTYYRLANKVVKLSKEVLGYSPIFYSWDIARDTCLAIEAIL